LGLTGPIEIGITDSGTTVCALHDGDLIMPTDKDDNPESVEQADALERIRRAIVEQDRTLQRSSEEVVVKQTPSLLVRVTDRKEFRTRITDGITSKILKSADLVVYLDGGPEMYFKHLEIIACAGMFMQAMGFIFPYSSSEQAHLVD
jgi:hypothetical protein